MSHHSFIAQRILPRGRRGFSGTLVHVATASVALCVVVMILSIAILRGFQNEIERKVAGFGSQIVVRSYQTEDAVTIAPISTDRAEYTKLTQVPSVEHIQSFAEKGGMLKTEEQIHGIILKGVDRHYDTTFFFESLQEGHLPDFLHGDTSKRAKNEILVSRRIADKLKLGIEDKVRAYFWQGDNYRARMFVVAGIYNTDLSDFDEHYLLGDLSQVQKLNGWDSNLVDGYELLMPSVPHKQLEYEARETLLPLLGYDLTVLTLTQRNPTLFAWLDLLNSNIWLIIGIMTLVCIVSIVSTFLIIIFEQTTNIGVLKTLGCSNGSIRRVFLIISGRIIMWGILIGNALALTLCLLQKHFSIISLDPESYSMSFVPIELNALYFIVISIGTLLVSLLAILLPASYISKINPAKTVKWE